MLSWYIMPKTQMIKIPEEAQGEIFLLARQARWSKERIGESCAHVLTACERMRRKADAALWSTIRRVAPGASELSNAIYDADAGVVLERDENGKRTGKAVEIPRAGLGEIGLLLEDYDCASGAIKLVGEMAMAMEERAEERAERLRMAIVRHIPETGDGALWEIDDKRMVVIRVADSVEKEVKQRGKQTPDR